jgi:hypothetical protein
MVIVVPAAPTVPVSPNLISPFIGGEAYATVKTGAVPPITNQSVEGWPAVKLLPPPVVRVISGFTAPAGTVVEVARTGPGCAADVSPVGTEADETLHVVFDDDLKTCDTTTTWL